MATTNKALTTYLPNESVEWLERYCLDYKHLLNKEGNPKLGTALADIISRLADGELTLPPKIEPTSTVVDNAQYGTEIVSLKCEIDELRKVVAQYSTNNVPSTLLDDSLRGEVDELKKLLTEYGTNKLPDTVLDSEMVDKRINDAIVKLGSPGADIDGQIKSQIDPVVDMLGELEKDLKEYIDNRLSALTIPKPLAGVR
jgi:hypothetical protein